MSPFVSQFHFVTGKGGVGKTCVSAALALSLCKKNQGPVLYIEVQGNGMGLKILGLNQQPRYEIHGLGVHPEAWGMQLTPRPAFQEYMGHVLALGMEKSLLGQATHQMREKVCETVVSNKIVSAFIDVCPGLEPSVILGKIHYELTQGKDPDRKRRWAYVVVDAPATGHSLMIFKSTLALTGIFGSGLIFKQASRIQSDIKNPEIFVPWIVSTCEELPLQEAREITKGLHDLNLPAPRLLLNRVPATKTVPTEKFPDLREPSKHISFSDLDAEWAKALGAWQEEEIDQIAIARDFLKNNSYTNLHWLPELTTTSGDFDLNQASELLDTSQIKGSPSP